MANYTDEEMSRILQMPSAVLVDAIIADAGGAVVGMREFMAGEKFISEASEMYPGSALIQEMRKNVDLPKLEEAIQPILSLGDQNAVRAECQKKISNGLAALGNDADANKFKTFLAALAEKVVNAAGQGFFDNRGARVSEKEAAYLGQLKEQLGVA